MEIRSLRPSLLGALALACTTLGVAAPAAAQEAPELVVLPRTAVTPPDGLFPTCVTGPSSLPMQTVCPVIRFDGYTTWGMTRRDNEYGMHLVTYDGAGRVVRDVPSSATRYLYKATIDTAARTVTFWAQGDSRADVAWADLPRPEPQIVSIAQRSSPAVPAGLKIVCGPMGQAISCPVIQYRGFTTWIHSYDDNRLSYAVVSYDAQGNVVAKTELVGDRYIQHVTTNPGARTLTLTGQHNIAVALPWASLP